MKLISEPDITVDYDDAEPLGHSFDDRQQSRQLAMIKPTGLIRRRLLYPFRHFKTGVIVKPVAKEETSRNSLSFSVLNIRAGNHFVSEYYRVPVQSMFSLRPKAKLQSCRHLNGIVPYVRCKKKTTQKNSVKNSTRIWNKVRRAPIQQTPGSGPKSAQKESRATRERRTAKSPNHQPRTT